jgi:benzodiazapine receptor
VSAILTLVLCVTGCLLVGMLGNAATQPNLEPWYAELRKPPFTPPNKVFGPAWGVLFILMGVALSILVQAEAGPGRTLALALFGLQLVLNAAWSWIFFGARSPGWAMLEIIVFDVAVAATLVSAWQVSTVAGALLVPYLCWVCFASYLNMGVWLLNRPGGRAGLTP